MATVDEGQKEQTKRDRAFLGQLPSDFLRVEESPRSEQRTNNGQRDHPHLVPMTYTPLPTQFGHGDGYVGRLKVTIAQAKLVKNYGLTRMDPYCRVRIGHSVYETPTDVNGSKNPRWNKAFSINLARGVTSMYIEVFNERYLSLDDRIAWGYYEFPEDMYKGETIEEWVPLTGKQGDEKEGNVNMIMSLTPLQQTYHHQLSAYGGHPVVLGGQPSFNPGYQYPPGFVPQQPVLYPQYPAPVAVPQQGPPHPTGGPVPRRPITDEDVKSIQEMFPTVEEGVIRSVLEAAGGNTDQAVTNLLTMTTD